MTEATWQVGLTLAARPPRRMRTAAHPSNAMTFDAKRLAPAAMATRARRRITTRRRPVRILARKRANPPGRVRTSCALTERMHALSAMAVAAERIAVARGAETRVGPGLFRMPGHEAGAVQVHAHRVGKV